MKEEFITAREIIKFGICLGVGFSIGAALILSLFSLGAKIVM